MVGKEITAIGFISGKYNLPFNGVINDLRLVVFDPHPALMAV